MWELFPSLPVSSFSMYSVSFHFPVLNLSMFLFMLYISSITKLFQYWKFCLQIIVVPEVLRLLYYLTDFYIFSSAEYFWVVVQVLLTSGGRSGLLLLTFLFLYDKKNTNRILISTKQLVMVLTWSSSEFTGTGADKYP